MPVFYIFFFSLISGENESPGQTNIAAIAIGVPLAVVLLVMVAIIVIFIIMLRHRSPTFYRRREGTSMLISSLL